MNRVLQEENRPEDLDGGKDFKRLGGEGMEKLTLSVTEAAAVVGVSRSTMYQMVKIDGFPTVHIGNRVLVSAKGLERWVDEQAKKGWSPN